MVADYQKMKRPRDVFQFIKNIRKIILKAKNTTLDQFGHSIEQINDKTYSLTNQGKNKKYMKFR